MTLIHHFLKWHHQGKSRQSRNWALIIGALIFPITIPIFLLVAAPRIDRSIGFGSLFSGWEHILIGSGAILSGGFVAIWTIVIQITLASGTPFPMLPTRKLLIVGPFKLCRNPMTLGTIMVYGGIAIAIGSVTAMTAVAVFAVFLIVYLKTIEERELLERFGNAYAAYKRKTPFILPIKGLNR